LIKNDKRDYFEKILIANTNDSKAGMGNYFCSGSTFSRPHLAVGRTFLWE